MAYTPDAATQAALAKSRARQALTPAEQTLLTTHSKRMIADMAPRVNTGGGGPYDYNSGTTGGYGYGMDQPFKTGSGLEQYNPNEIAERYQNFLREEDVRKANGFAPRPMPVQFAQLAGSGAFGMTASQATSQGMYVPTQGSAGYNNLVQAGILSDPNIPRATPIQGSPYGGGSTPSTPTPQFNPGMTPGSTPTQVNTNPTATLPFNPADALPSAPVTVRTPNGGLALGNTVAGIDEGKLLAEAELQKDLRRRTYEQQVSGRKAMLDELSGVLQKQQQAALGDQMPGI